MKDEFLDHLLFLESAGYIKVWEDVRGIVPDEEWERQIITQLNHSDIIILLVSSPFLAPSYCSRTELPIALKRFKEKKCLTTWVLLYQCQWRRTPLAKLQSWPVHGRVMPTRKSKREEAWCKVADMIVEYVERVTA